MSNGQDYTLRYRNKDKQVDPSQYDYTEMYRRNLNYKGTVAANFYSKSNKKDSYRADSSLSRYDHSSNEWKDAVGLISKSLSSNEQKQVFKEFLELSGVV